MAGDTGKTGFPQEILLLALGLIGGLLVRVMWVFVSGAWRQVGTSLIERFDR